jgi:hypothetical protein
VEVPNSAYHVVAVPFGLTVPDTVAVDAVSAETGPVVTDGALAANAKLVANPAARAQTMVRTSLAGQETTLPR